MSKAIGVNTNSIGIIVENMLSDRGNGFKIDSVLWILLRTSNQSDAWKSADIASIVGTLFIRIKDNSAKEAEVQRALNTGNIFSILLTLIARMY